MMIHQDESVVNRRLLQNRKLGHHSCDVLGHEFQIFPTVFSPEVNSSTRWAASVVPQRAAPVGGKMLEIGTGCGAIGIISALSGVSHVTATDINPQAVECAEVNAKSLGVRKESMKFVVSDIYDSLNHDDKFNVIFWNFPFNYPKEEKSTENMDFCAQSLFDPGYNLLGRYLSGARDFLLPKGRVFITFSPDTGNTERFNYLTKKYDWKPVLFASKEVHALAEFSASFHLYELIDTQKTVDANTMGS